MAQDNTYVLSLGERTARPAVEWLDRPFRNGYIGHMKSATITEVKNQLSSIIDRVRAGESVVVTDRGRPVARIEPVRTDVDDDSRLVRLERSGIIRPAPKSPPPPRAALPVAAASAVDALIDERRSGR